MLTLIMLPLRSHLSVATTALVLVLPVVVGVVSGGFSAGAVGVVGGFLVYDYFFIPPYLTVDVGARENWTALAVYVAVMLPVARVVANMNKSRAQARRQGNQIRQLFELSALLVEDKPFEELVSIVVTTLRDVLEAHQVVLQLPREDHLEIVATAGRPLTAQDRERLRQAPGQVASPNTGDADRGSHFSLALTAAGRPVGMLAIAGPPIDEQHRESLHIFANQIALALERGQLREQAMRAELTDEVERLARTLVAAVSHDLRSPLASIKASSSVLADPQLAHELDPSDRRELACLIDAQTDRLTALVANLLDMSRVQAGVLQPRVHPTRLPDLIDSVLADLPPTARLQPPTTALPPELPLLSVDFVLISRVLNNLLQNAMRHSPKESPITVSARLTDPGIVTVAVADHGPGVAPDQRNEIFDLFVRRAGDAGTGLGLAIAKMFVEAHQQHIWVEETPGGGACFCFTVPVAASGSEES